MRRNKTKNIANHRPAGRVDIPCAGCLLGANKQKQTAARGHAPPMTPRELGLPEAEPFVRPSPFSVVSYFDSRCCQSGCDFRVLAPQQCPPIPSLLLIFRSSQPLAIASGIWKASPENVERCSSKIHFSDPHTAPCWTSDWPRLIY